jgi:hypothetical protein
MLPTPRLLRPKTNLVRKRRLFRRFAIEVFVIGLRVGAGSFDMDQCGPVATEFDYICGICPKRGYQFSGAFKHVLVFNRRAYGQAKAAGVSREEDGIEARKNQHPN